jgi:hypothetical protein
MFRAVVCVTAVLALGGPALAQDGQPKSFTFVKGECANLLQPGRDLSSDCQDVLVVSDYTNNRFNIAFAITGQRGMVGFSGDNRQRTTTSGGEISQPVDRVVLVSPGSPVSITNVPGSGTCVWKDFESAASAVVCDFATDDGHFQGKFQPDGSPPDVRTF